MCDNLVFPPNNIDNQEQQVNWLKRIQDKSNETSKCIQALVKDSICNDECQSDRITPDCIKCAKTNGCRNVQHVYECDTCIASQEGLSRQCETCSTTKKPIIMNFLIFLIIFTITIFIFKLLK